MCAVQTISAPEVEFIRIRERSLDAGTSTRFRDRVSSELNGSDCAVLDFGEVEWIDSAGLDALLCCLREFNLAGVELRLCNVSSPVRSMFELVGLDQLISVHANREEALAAL